MKAFPRVEKPGLIPKNHGDAFLIRRGHSMGSGADMRRQKQVVG